MRTVSISLCLTCGVEGVSGVIWRGWFSSSRGITVEPKVCKQMEAHGINDGIMRKTNNDPRYEYYNQTARQEWITMMLEEW